IVKGGASIYFASLDGKAYTLSGNPIQPGTNRSIQFRDTYSLAVPQPPPQLISIVAIKVLVLTCAYQCSVTYRVIRQDPNKTEAAIDIREQSLYWTIVLRFSNKVRLKDLDKI
ncbi:unnamed protein product, partial [Oppiella nova]